MNNERVVCKGLASKGATMMNEQAIYKGEY